jgi:uncharacterized protein (TIGR03083 family)
MSEPKDVSAIAALGHEEAMKLATEEWDRLLALAESLTPQEWARPTDCVGWDVRAMLGHLLGMVHLQADAEERGRQIKAAATLAARNNTRRIDELTGLQVADHARLSTEELLAALREAVPRGLAARRALVPPAADTPYDSELPGEPIWTLGHLFDVIHTRDPWLHRIDICRATDREPLLTPDHDGRIIENVVAEWATRHGEPFRLELTGPAGGRYATPGAADGLPALRIDAVEFCRVLSGRAAGDGLLATPVVF